MSFDHLAPFYRAMERIAAGGTMQRCRLAFLADIPLPTRILLAGEGPGRFLVECTRRFPHAEIVVVDFSKRMLEIAARHVSSPQVKFIHVDLVEEIPEVGFDLVVTNFFLDCFAPDQLRRVVENLAGSASPSASWLIADFHVPEGFAAGFRSRVILTMLYAFFRLFCGLGARSLVPPEPHLKASGFLLHRRTTHDWGLMKSEWWRRG